MGGIILAKVDGSKKLLLAHFLAISAELWTATSFGQLPTIEVSGAAESGELRDEQGYQILTDTDRADLKPGQYVMISAERKEASERAISKETRARNRIYLRVHLLRVRSHSW